MEHFPSQLETLLSSDIFTYANIPYILKSYEEILQDSKDTILFDFEKDRAIEDLCANVGSDGKLIFKEGDVYLVNLTEKLLVPLLSKMSNLLVGGGIWMNTQRPEWNDANNAIVGIGLSMVTVYHVKAYLEFLRELYTKQNDSYTISKEVSAWMLTISSSLSTYTERYAGNEKAILDKMGEAFSSYRLHIYDHEFSTKMHVTAAEIVENLTIYIDAIDYTIEQNKSTLYSTYNLLTEDFQAMPMRNMLEGQSAVIGSGFLSADEICSLLTAMEEELLDPSLNCHTLYPVKKTTRFMEKNLVQDTMPPVEGITYKDANGHLRFHSHLITEEHLMQALDSTKLSESEKASLLTTYEQVFSHKQFTGRSQVMYKFEGIGCVYWHQNAKLALAVLEGVGRERDHQKDASQIYTAYKKLMSGFIYRKTPEECNAIPVEPYSHTSFNKTSEQPGMTGQVKESVIMRRMELGVRVNDGCIHFDPWFISPEEYMENGEINFTIYGIPTKYTSKQTTTDTITIQITYHNGSSKVFDGSALDAATSKAIFMRTNEIISITIQTI